MTVLLCLSGQIGSGKSSVSIALSEALDWPRTGFGDYLRAEIVRSGGDPESRQLLQELGQKRVDADPVLFCRDVLAFGGFVPGANFVIDGVRHVAIFDILAGLATPSSARLLFLQVNDANRAARVATRADSADLPRAEQHRVEAELREELPRRADAVVDAGRPLDHVVAVCGHFARAWS